MNSLEIMLEKMSGGLRSLDQKKIIIIKQTNNNKKIESEDNGNSSH